MQARHLVVAAGSPANESCIAMIEDGLDDMDFFTKHLKDGQDFYSVMSPKLEQVKQQIGDISVRLAVERFEHEESADRQQRTSHPRPALALPGVVPVGHDEPHVQVDDVKVARLVQMGLDLGKAVVALKKYDNNVDLALNELLSCWHFVFHKESLQHATIKQLEN